MKEDIKSLDYNELTETIKEMGYPGYRAGQIYTWLHCRNVESFDQMTDIPLKLKTALDERFTICILEAVTVKCSKSDNTHKYLFKLPEGDIPLKNDVIESVYMEYHHGVSVCISSQVGCRMGCRFCASTIGGLERNLSVSEMLEQIYRIQALSNKRVSNIVVMGTGEPLDNYDNLVKFIKMVSDDKGINISQRNITVSTCGLAEKIRRLADEQLTITLALSLHAPNDETRRKLMPVANKYTIAEVISAMDYYFDKTGRRITYEYSLVAGDNDSSECAEELSALLRNKNCHVNLIPVNPVNERSYKASGITGINNFKNILEKNRINVTIRKGMGSDIDAACGQLRKSHAENLVVHGGEQDEVIRDY